MKSPSKNVFHSCDSPRPMMSFKVLHSLLSNFFPHMRLYKISHTSFCIILQLMDHASFCIIISLYNGYVIIVSVLFRIFFLQSNNRIKDPFFSSLEHKVSYLNQHLNSYFPFSIASKELGIIWITYNSHESNYGFVPE